MLKNVTLFFFFFYFLNYCNPGIDFQIWKAEKKKNEKQLVNINFAECCCLTSFIDV